MKKDLNGQWEFKQTDAEHWLTATVPGCNYLDLMALNEIPDPFYGVNEEKVKWVSQKDWEYRKYFEISKDELSYDEITLECKTLDTICDVYINGHSVGKCENYHIAYSFYIKAYLQEGENEIHIVFFSPVEYVKNIYKKESAPPNSNGQNGIVHIRKPQYHFGWDWGPVLAPSGISGDIYLSFNNFARLQSLSVTQEHSDSAVTVKAFADIKLLQSSGVTCEISISYPDSTIVTQEGEKAEFVIKNPELWWTHELSGKDRQPLYTVCASIYHGDTLVDKAEKKIGLRTITLNRERDKYGSNFQFILNGVPIFAKGANYIPPDSFLTRFNKEKLCRLLDTARFSNMNMLRVWGGGVYESDEFYDECDLRGILVWQDFCFACQAYPFFKEDFLENVKMEVSYNVQRLSHHASLALWNGNNEIEDMHLAWVTMKKYVDWTETFFYHILEPKIRKYDISTPYIPGSPCGISHNNGVSCDNVGDTHLWAVWHGLQPMNYYRKRLTRFCSEFGFESLPGIKTIEKFAEPEDYSLSGQVFTAHQKCTSGNDKMIYYIASRFRLPSRFEDFIYLSQVTQQECISDATEHWRRNKGRCNGSLYWQFNDCWPVCSWSGMDYYGNYKALQYCARNFNAPVSISLEDTKKYIKVFALNDLTQEQNLDIECEIFDFEKGTLQKKTKSVVLKSLENSEIYSIDVPGMLKKYSRKRTGVCVRLYKSHKKIMQKTVLLDKEKNLNLPKTKPAISVSYEGNELQIRVCSNCFARLVRLQSSLSALNMSDNYFDLLPGEEKCVTMPLDSNLTPQQQAQSISVFSCCDTVSANNPLKDSFIRMKVALTPANIVNYMYRRKVPADAVINS